jgi:hypothetical protein
MGARTGDDEEGEKGTDVGFRRGSSEGKESGAGELEKGSGVKRTYLSRN